MLFCGENGKKIVLFLADPRVIFSQSSDNFTKMILLFKINDIGLNVNAQQLEFSRKFGDTVSLP